MAVAPVSIIGIKKIKIPLYIMAVSRYNNGVEWQKVAESGVVVMFIGQFRHTLDDKNRIIIPSKFREAFGTGAIIALGYNCLTIYDRQTFQASLNEIREKSENAKALTRMIAGNAEEINFDKSGRVIIPGFLIDELPELDESRELTILGAGDHIEIWPKARWTAYFQKSKPRLEE